MTRASCSPRQALHDVAGVLFDFDGPLCHLFATVSAPSVARELWTFIERERLPALDTVPIGKRQSPVDIFKGAVDKWEDPRDVARLERRLTKWERRAVEGAKATDGAVELVRSLHGRVPMAITTNNSEKAVRRHLEICDIAKEFGERIHGRPGMRGGRPRKPRLKPDPDCIERALSDFGPVDRAKVLMIGDSPDDVEAALSAGVRFLGFQNPDGNTVLTDRYPGIPLVHHLAELGEYRC
ncbi:HAD family hydrolase [Streptomyces sp. NPDC058864]